eukprot:5514387-Pleurochrysis_carterae.AAC.1
MEVRRAIGGNGRRSSESEVEAVASKADANAAAMRQKNALASVCRRFFFGDLPRIWRISVGILRSSGGYLVPILWQDTYL